MKIRRPYWCALLLALLILGPVMFAWSEPTAESYLKSGEQKYLKGDYDGAIVDYTEAIRLDPKCAMAYGYRCVAKKAKGDIQGSDADFDQARRLDPRIGN